jgi:hypothetical protein
LINSNRGKTESGLIRHDLNHSKALQPSLQIVGINTGVGDALTDDVEVGNRRAVDFNIPIPVE